MGFMVDKVVLGQVFSENFSFLANLQQLLHTHHHLSSKACTIGQRVADVPIGLSLSNPEPSSFQNEENGNDYDGSEDV
jgi:hypothetical protein